MKFWEPKRALSIGPQMPRLNLGVCTGEKLDIQGKDTDSGKENALPATPSTPSEGSDTNENLGSKATTTGGSVIELTVSRVSTLSKLSVESVREIQLGVASEVSGGDEDAWTYIALKQSRSEEESRQNTSTHWTSNPAPHMDSRMKITVRSTSPSEHMREECLQAE